MPSHRLTSHLDRVPEGWPVYLLLASIQMRVPSGKAMIDSHHRGLRWSKDACGVFQRSAPFRREKMQPDDNGFALLSVAGKLDARAAGTVLVGHLTMSRLVHFIT